MLSFISRRILLAQRLYRTLARGRVVGTIIILAPSHTSSMKVLRGVGSDRSTPSHIHLSHCEIGQAHLRSRDTYLPCVGDIRTAVIGIVARTITKAFPSVLVPQCPLPSNHVMQTPYRPKHSNAMGGAIVASERNPPSVSSDAYSTCVPIPHARQHPENP